MWLAVTSSARHGNAVTSSTLLADPPSNETLDVFYIKDGDYAACLKYSVRIFVE